MSRRANILAAGIFQPIAPLLNMCNPVPLDPHEPLLVAIVGPGNCILNIDPAPFGLEQPRPTRDQLTDMVNSALFLARRSDVTRRMPPVCEGIDAVQLVAVFFLWSMENPFRIYRLITDPLNVRGVRTVESLRDQLPLIKLLCIAHRSIPRSSDLWYLPQPRSSTPPHLFCMLNGPLYRGINIDLNAIMRAKYDTYETSFAVNTLITFPAPTACSTNSVVAGNFTNGIQFVIENAGGVSLCENQLSVYNEGEVMLPFPSSFRVTARSKVQNTVVVVINAVDAPMAYCTAHGAHVVRPDQRASVGREHAGLGRYAPANKHVVSTSHDVTISH
jgi:hypothetical protein